MGTKKQDKLIEKIETLCFMVAATDGISEMEGFELDMIQGRIRMLLDAKSAVTEYEKSGDMKKALSNLKEPLMLTHVMKFGMADHIQAIDKEVSDLLESNPDNAQAEYEVLLKIHASDIEDDYDRKVAMLCIRDVYDVDGSSSIERWAHLVLGKEWGVSIMKANKWANEFVFPVIEESQKNIEF